MPSPSSPALQRLHRLGRSSPDFHDQLCNVLCGREYVQCERNLEGNDLVWLIDYLDEALASLDPSSPASRKCLCELRDICGVRMTLPTSYSLSSHLLQIDHEPFAPGGSCDVYRGTLRGSKVCIKRIRDVQGKAAQTFCREAVVWKRLTHPNVLPLLGITLTPFQFISNWISGGNLLQYVQKHPDADQLRLLSDVAEGLCYLHSRGVIHGDLKGPNILVESSGRACIADFGLAKITKDPSSTRNSSHQSGYTVRWAAPEVLIKEEYSKEADIFSLAMVIIEIFTREVPFSDLSPPMAMFAITQGERPSRPSHPNFTGSLWSLMQHCWQYDPHLRPEASEFLQTLRTLDPPIWKRLISYTLPTDECINLITSIFSDRNEVEAVGHLSGGDAQTFIDTIDEALDSLTPEIKRGCLRYLSRICDHRHLLPKSLLVPLFYNPIETPLYAGEIADVWRGRSSGKEVAAKVLRIPATDFGWTRKRFYKEVVTWKVLRHPNVLPLLGVTATEDRFVMVSEWMANGDINRFAKDHPDANRLELLADVAKGLSYMHDLGIVHGNLNGSNILIDDNGHARLAGFNLLTIIPDEQSTVSSDPSSGITKWVGSARWSAPEVLEGEVPSTKSDIFAFAMVMIEVFTGTVPFDNYPSSVAVSTIVQGRRPPRPTHPGVTGRLWKLIQQCWGQHPHSRPGASEVLQILLDSNPVAWKQLISPNTAANERVDLMKSIFSDRDEVEVFEYLSGDDAQAFVDVIDEVLDNSDNLPREIRRSCLRSSYRICGREGLLPRSLSIQLRYNPREAPQCSGGLSDVWKGEYDGRAVAAKALRIYSMNDFEGIRKRFCKEVVTWKTLRHRNVLPLLGVTITEDPCRLVMVSKWMENGNINTFVKAHPDVNRLKLLADVSQGLIYMHNEGVVHGDLKGANIMIHDDRRALLADFGLIALVPDRSTYLSTCLEGGTFRWMSPELLNPKAIGLQESRPTRESDCYALGMVVYEVLSGCAPFGTNNSFAILRNVLDGEHPERPQGVAGTWFTDDIWDMVRLCWKSRPSERASAKYVHMCLEGRPTAASTDSASPIAPNEGGSLVPPLDSLPSVPSSPVIPHEGGQLPDPPQIVNLNEGRIGIWLALIAWHIFNVVTRPIHFLLRARW